MLAAQAQPLTLVGGALGLAVAALVGLTVGIEREWSGHATGPGARFAGARTFFLLGGLGGLVGWLMMAGGILLGAVLLGGAVLLVSDRLRGRRAPRAGRSRRHHRGGGPRRPRAGHRGGTRIPASRERGGGRGRHRAEREEPDPRIRAAPRRLGAARRAPICRAGAGRPAAAPPGTVRPLRRHPARSRSGSWSSSFRGSTSWASSPGAWSAPRGDTVSRGWWAG